MEDITEGKADARSWSRHGHISRRSFLIDTDGFADVSSRIADIISTVEFDHTGNYLATGDKGGRVVLFERNETVGFTSTNA